MSKQFLKAFKKASSEALEGSGYELELITEMIGTGSSSQIEKALDQFFGFHDVELVTGIATRYGLQHSFDKFQKHKVPFILNCLGEHFIPTEGYNEHVFINSVHMWQQNWCLGYYAGKNLGKRGIAYCSMYDSGYSLMPAFQEGMNAADPDNEFSFKLLPMTEAGQLSPVAESFDQINFEEYDFVFTMLCGEEATIFLNEFKKRGLHEKTTLLGMPFLLEAGEEDLSGVSVYSSHYEADQATEDPLFNKVFMQFGTTTGRAVAQAVIDGEGEVDQEVVARALAKVDPQKIHPSGEFPQLNSPIAIVKHSYGAGNELSTELIETQRVDLKENERINMARDEFSSCWVNPYMAI